MRSPSDALLLAIFVFLRLYTVVAHSSMSRFLRRGISRFPDCSGFSGSVWSMNCMNSLTLRGARLSAAMKSFVCSCSFSYLRFHTLTSRLSVSTLFFKSPISPREATPSLLGKLPDPLVVFISALASSYQSYPRSISTAPAPAAS